MTIIKLQIDTDKQPHAIKLMNNYNIVYFQPLKKDSNFILSRHYIVCMVSNIMRCGFRVGVKVTPDITQVPQNCKR